MCGGEGGGRGDRHPQGRRAEAAETWCPSQAPQRCLGGTKERLMLKGHSIEPGEEKDGEEHMGNILDA